MPRNRRNPKSSHSRSSRNWPNSSIGCRTAARSSVARSWLRLEPTVRSALAKDRSFAGFTTISPPCWRETPRGNATDAASDFVCRMTRTILTKLTGVASSSSSMVGRFTAKNATSRCRGATIVASMLRPTNSANTIVGPTIVNQVAAISCRPSAIGAGASRGLRIAVGPRAWFRDVEGGDRRCSCRRWSSHRSAKGGAEPRAVIH